MTNGTVLITGAAKRVGAACARLLHDSGYAIAIHYRGSRDAAVALCNELNNKRAQSATIYQADLLSQQELNALVEKVISDCDNLAVLINNASAFYATDLATITERQWDELLGSNLKAPFFLTAKLAETLAKNNGCVVNIIDVHSERGLPGYPVYSIAKAGLAAMTRIMAKELGPEVRVNGISPGAILWPEHDMTDEDKEALLARVILRRSGNPEDIARAVRFLIREADYVTGQIIRIDGGRMLFS